MRRSSFCAKTDPGEFDKLRRSMSQYCDNKDGNFTQSLLEAPGSLPLHDRRSGGPVFFPKLVGRQAGNINIVCHHNSLEKKGTHMKHIFKVFTLVSLAGGVAYAQQQEMRGSDTLSGLTRAIITDQGLDSQLLYTGGGSGTGFANTCIARTSGQTVNPASRAANQADRDCATPNNLQYLSDVVGMDGVNVIINQNNMDLVNIKATDVGNIYHCDYTTWDQVPTSTVGGPIRRYARDGNSGTSDVFIGRLFWRDSGGIHQFPSLPSGDENYWEERFSCVTAIHGDGATLALGAIAASDARAIVYAGDPALQQGNRALCVSDDVNFDPPHDPVCPGVSTIEDLSYYCSRQLYFHHVIGISDTFGPTGAQLQLLSAVNDPTTSCAYLDQFLPSFGFFQAPRCYNP